MELLLAPSQRVNDYVRLVSALRHSTPADHPDLAQLDAAMKPISKLQQLLNEVSNHCYYYWYSLRLPTDGWFG